MDDPSTTLAELRASLEGLEAACEPLFSKPYRETLAGLDNVEKAKMDVLLAFAINNLVWVYLRSRGIDPETHDVTRELERVKTYYGKVRAAEGSPAERARIDVGAATRMIAHSLPSRRDPAPGPSSSAAAIAKSQAEEATATRSNRFRFVAKEGEKMIPGVESMDVDEEEEDEEEDVRRQADSLLDGVEADIVAQEVREVSSKKKKNKRKRTDRV